MSESPIYNTFKMRASIVYPLEDVGREQTAKTWSFFNKVNYAGIIENVNEFLIHLMNIPELLSASKNLRRDFNKKVNHIFNVDYLARTIDKDVSKAIKEYFGWLKLRSDYVESEEELKERTVSNTKRMKKELFEKLYYPDRCDRMLLAYGDAWVDTHFP